MTFKRTNEKREEAIAKLAEYVTPMKDGEELPWIRIEADTGIKMDQDGRDLFRAALRRIGRQDYERQIGVGVRLSTADTTLQIMGAKVKSAYEAAKRVEKAGKRLEERHRDQFTAAQAQGLQLVRATIGALRAVVSSSRDVAKLPAGQKSEPRQR